MADADADGEARTLALLLAPALAPLRDVTLFAGRTGGSVRAHRAVLAAASPVLRASLAAEPGTGALTLAHADVVSLERALKVVYGDAAALDGVGDAGLWDCLNTCVAYAILKPLDAVQARLVDAVAPGNVFYHWENAERFSLDTVHLRCRAVVKERFGDVVATPEFDALSAQQVARVLRIHDLCVDSEHQVFYALEKWLAVDLTSRADHALRLLRLVRLPTISDRVLLRVCRSAYFGGHDDFYQLLLEALIRRAEVRILHAPRIASLVRKRRVHRADPPGAATQDFSVASLSFAPAGATDADLMSSRVRSPKSGRGSWGTLTSSIGGSSVGGHTAASRLMLDVNRREERAVLFEGVFPLRWYKNVRFRARSPTSMLFTVVIPNWSKSSRRFVSESRSFLDHKWSLWVDPYASESHEQPGKKRGSDERSEDPAPGSASDERRSEERENLLVGSTDPLAPSSPRSRRRPQMQRQSSHLVAETSRVPEPETGSTGSMPRSPRPASGSSGDMDYISIYLCCESELVGSQAVDARVDFALFIASAQEEYGMERKMCIGRSFSSHGQAMGFRRHIRRNRIFAPSIGYYNEAKDELVVGAHLISPKKFDTQDRERPDRERDETPLGGRYDLSPGPGQTSPTSLALHGSRVSTIDTDISPSLYI